MRRGLFMIVAAVALMSCIGGSGKGEKVADSDTKTATNIVNNNEDVVEVLYMHGKQRCVTCVAIGTEAEAVIKELGNDKVVMRSVDFSTPEGEKIADRYEISSSSIIVVKGSKVDNLTAIGFQYAKNNPDQFKKSLRESIQKMLE